MKAVFYNEFGGLEKLQYGDVPEPKVGPDSVLVKVKAASVNPVDWKILHGYLDGISYTHFPVTIGWDVAGIVEQIGACVSEFAVGDEIIGYARMDMIEHGTFAEKIAAPVRTLAHKPKNVSWEEAATIPLAGLTAYQGLTRYLQIKPEETLFISGGAGGVGTYAIQIAVACGAKVIASASENNHNFLRKLGAEPVVYGTGLATRIKNLVPEGITAYFDLFGGDDSRSIIDLVADKTRIASIADGSVKQIGGHYVFVRPDSADLLALTKLVENEKVKPIVAATFPLTEAKAAYKLSMSGHVQGKIAVSVS